MAFLNTGTVNPLLSPPGAYLLISSMLEGTRPFIEGG